MNDIRAMTRPLRVLGIDLASTAKRTAACRLQWGSGTGRILDLQKPVKDDLAVELAADADLVAIDAPFGWPASFVAAVSGHERGEEWPRLTTPELAYRRTDTHVRKQVGWWPLSVSADRTGIVAFRAARLAGLLRPGSAAVRDGSNGLVEVYPAAALHRWGLPHRGYKRPEGRQERAYIVEALPRVAVMDLGGYEEELVESDDQLDALIAALVGVAKHLGYVDPLSSSDVDAARTEGWIWLPTGARLT